MKRNEEDAEQIREACEVLKVSQCKFLSTTDEDLAIRFVNYRYLNYVGLFLCDELM